MSDPTPATPMIPDVKPPEFERTHKLYLHKIASGANVCLKSGKTIFFHGGQHATDNAKDILELDEMVKEEGGFIYVDPDRVTVDPKELDPIEVVKMQAIQEWIQKNLLVAQKKSGDTSYIPNPGVPTSSSELGQTLLATVVNAVKK